MGFWRKLWDLGAPDKPASRGRAQAARHQPRHRNAGRNTSSRSGARQQLANRRHVPGVSQGISSRQANALHWRGEPSTFMGQGMPERYRQAPKGPRKPAKRPVVQPTRTELYPVRVRGQAARPASALPRWR